MIMMHYVDHIKIMLPDAPCFTNRFSSLLSSLSPVVHSTYLGYLFFFTSNILFLFVCFFCLPLLMSKILFRSGVALDDRILFKTLRQCKILCSLPPFNFAMTKNLKLL